MSHNIHIWVTFCVSYQSHLPINNKTANSGCIISLKRVCQKYLTHPHIFYLLITSVDKGRALFLLIYQYPLLSIYNVYSVRKLRFLCRCTDLHALERVDVGRTVFRVYRYALYARRCLDNDGKGIDATSVCGVSSKHTTAFCQSSEYYFFASVFRYRPLRS